MESALPENDSTPRSKKLAQRIQNSASQHNEGSQKAGVPEMGAKRLLWQHPFVNIFKYAGVERWTDASYEGDVQLYIDRTIGKMCYRIAGSIPAKNFLAIPKKKTEALGLSGSYLYAMICVQPSKMFVMHFDLVVEEGFTVRLSISNIFKADEQDTKTIKLRYELPSDKWTVLGLDLKAILRERAGRAYRGLKSIQFCSRMLVKNAYTSNIVYDVETLPRDMTLVQSRKAEQVTTWQWLPRPPNGQNTPSVCRPLSRLSSMSSDDGKENINDNLATSSPRSPHTKPGLGKKQGTSAADSQLVQVLMSRSRPAGKSRTDVMVTRASPKQALDSARGRQPSRLGSEARHPVQRDPLLGIEPGEILNTEDPRQSSIPVRPRNEEATTSGREEADAEECSELPRIRIVRHDGNEAAAHESIESGTAESDASRFPTSGTGSPEAAASGSDESGSRETPPARDVFVVEHPVPRIEPAEKPGVCREASGVGTAPIMELEKVIGLSVQRTGNVLYSPDGSAVVFPSGSTIVAMDPTTGSQRFLMGHSTSVCALAFDAKGVLLGSAQEGKDPVIRVWDFASATCLAVLMTHASGLTSVDLSADGKALLGVGLDQHARQLIVVWDITPLPAGNRAVVLARHTTDHHVLTARFSPLEDNHLMTCGRNSIRLYRLKNTQLKGCSVNLAEQRQAALLKHIDKGSPAEITFTDLAFQLGYGLTELYEKRVYVSTASGCVFQVNYGRLTVERVFQLHTEPINSLAVTEGFCITGSGDRRLRVWPLEFTEFFMEMELEGEVTSTSVRADGLHVAFGTRSGSIGVLDMGNQRNHTLLRSHTNTVIALAIDPNLPQFSTVSNDRTVRIWALDTMEQLYEFDAPGDCPTSLAYHPRERVIACGFQSGMVRVFEIENTTLVHERQQHRGPVRQVLFLGSGDQLVSSGAEGNLCVYDATRGYAPAKILAAPTGKHHVEMARSVDGSQLATMGPDGKSVLLYNSLDWTQPPFRFAVSSGVEKLAFSPDASSLFAVTTGSRLEKYDVATGRMVGGVANVHQGDCQALAVSGDGALVATGGSDRLIKVWSPELDGSEQSFSGQTGVVLGAAFTNGNNPALLTVGEGNAILRWRLLAPRAA